MSTWKLIGLLATACASALVACTPKAPADRARINPAKAHAPYANCVNANRRLDAIVVKISDVSKLTATQWHYYTGPSGDHPGGAATQVNSAQPHPPYTDLDVDARPYLKHPNDIMLLELDLLQPGYTFTPGPNTILTDDANNGKMFCVKNPPTPTPNGATSVTFYVHYLEGASPGVVGTYTFDYLTPVGQVVRVKVDPDVTNDG